MAARIEYCRNSSAQGPNITLTDYEKTAILEVENVGGQWHPDGVEQTTGYSAGHSAYTRQDGARATMDSIHGVIEAKAFLDFDAARKAAAEQQLKSGQPKF